MPLFISDFLKNELNALARQIYSAMGYEVREGFDFTTSKHPQEKLCFAIAEMSYDFWQERLSEE